MLTLLAGTLVAGAVAVGSLAIFYLRIGEAVGLAGTAVALLLLTQLVFSVAYSLDVMQGVIGGVLLSGLAPAPEPAGSRAASTALEPVAAGAVYR